MKKTIALFLALLLALTLAACGMEPQSTGETQRSEQPAAPPAPFQQTGAIAETVLYEDNGVKITATSLDYNNHGAKLNLLLENNSGKDLTFVSGSIGYSQNSVNRYMVHEGYLNCDVKAGMKANDSMSFAYDALQMYGISAIAEMEIAFAISDADYHYTYTGPLSLQTSLAGTYDFAAESCRQALADAALQEKLGFTLGNIDDTRTDLQNGVAIVSASQCVNGDGESALLVEFENAAGQQVILGISEIAVNGLIVESGRWSADAVNAGKNDVMDIRVGDMMDEAILKAYGIETVEQIDFVVSLLDEQGNSLTDVPAHFALSGSPATVQIAGKEVYNANQLRITCAGYAVDSRDHVNLLLTAENTGTVDISLADEYDSLSVNGFMTDYQCHNETIPAGKVGTLIVQIDEDDLSENNITAPEQITDFTIELEIRDDDYNKIDTPTLRVEF